MAENPHCLWADGEIERLPSELTVPNTENQDDQLKTETTFFDSLPIEQWRQELVDLRRKGDLEAVERKELAIISELKQKLDQIPYEDSHGTPESMISGGKKNCEGASVLGSIVLEQIGINHRILLVNSPTDLPGHVLLLPISSHGHVFWSDMTATDLDLLIDESAFSTQLQEDFPDDLATVLS